MIFLYKVKGSADEQWNEGREIEAESREAAQELLDQEYEVQRDDEGKQTNAKYIKVVITGEK